MALIPARRANAVITCHSKSMFIYRPLEWEVKKDEPGVPAAAQCVNKRFVPNETQILEMSPEGQVLNKIEVNNIHEGKLYYLPDRCYFRSTEVYYNLLDNEHIRHNLYQFTYATHEVVEVIHDLQFFDVMFVYKNMLCGICSEMVYCLEDNAKFRPLGSFDFSRDNLMALFAGDSSFLPDVLNRPKRYDFEYAYKNETYTYFGEYMFTSDTQTKKITKREDFPHSKSLVQFEKKMLQIDDAVYGFSGEYLQVQQLLRLCRLECQHLPAIQWFQFENMALVNDNGHCMMVQHLQNVDDYYMDDNGQLLPVLKDDAPRVYFDEQQRFAKIEGTIKDKAICEYPDQRVKLYSFHAIKTDASGAVVDVVELPELLRPGQQIKLVSGSLMNGGHSLNMGFLSQVDLK